MVFAAALALVMNHQPLVASRLVTDRFQKPLAVVRPVSRVDVDVARVQAPRAMVATGLRSRGYFAPAK